MPKKLNNLDYNPISPEERWSIYGEKKGLCLNQQSKWFRIQLNWRWKQEITILEYE